MSSIIFFDFFLQTWLDQFARTNGGSSPSEYAGVDRVRLLHTLKVLKLENYCKLKNSDQ